MDSRFIKGVELVKGVYAKPLYLDSERMVILFEIYEDIPMHKHVNLQIGIILDGRGVFKIGGEEKEVEKEVFYHIPSNVEHELRVMEKPVKALDIFIPPREDYKKLFMEV